MSLKTEKPSLKSKIIYASLKSVNFSKLIFNQLLNRPKRGTDIVSSKHLNNDLITVKRNIEGFKILTISNQDSSNTHIIFLHGGAYVAEAVKGHKYLIEKFTLSYNFKVSFIDYPLAPENNAIITLHIAEKAYKEIAMNYPQDTFHIFGDSAGGGLALALLQKLEEKKETAMPLKTVLVSPWTDVSMSNPEIKNYIHKDVLLTYEGLIKCAKLYADGLDLKDPIVSPIYGNLKNLSSVKIFVSNYELFYPDCVSLNEKLNSAEGTNSSLSVKNRMIHDWIVLPLREREETIQELVDFILKK